jgi:hypothetical protein
MDDADSHEVSSLRTLLPWLPAGSARIVRAIIDAGGDREAAAAALNSTRARVRKRLWEARRQAARRGWSPDHDMTHATPDGYHVRGVSTLYNAAGGVVAQWVKTQADAAAKAEALRAFVEEIVEPIRGAVEPTQNPFAASDDDLLVVVPVGDHHLGMLAHSAETGESWDTAKGDRVLRAAIGRAMEVAPDASELLLAFMGDFFHADDETARTPASKHALDIDSRFPEVARIAARLTRHCIDLGLEHFPRVSFLPVGGNHDPHASFWLGLVVEALYSSEPRVSVMDPRRGINYRQHGECLLAFTHGHGIKRQQVAAVTAADVPEIWGTTKHRHAYTGHVHHDSLTEGPGMTVESVRILPARDRYAAHHGYRSGRDLKVDVWHATRGPIVRHRIGIGDLT